MMVVLQCCVVVIWYVVFEDCGMLGIVLVGWGWEFQILQVGIDLLDVVDIVDLLIVLGGFISVNDIDIYLFLCLQLVLLECCLWQQWLIFGICLGVQLIVCVFGGWVVLMGVWEIGFVLFLFIDVGMVLFLCVLVGILVLYWYGEMFMLLFGVQCLVVIVVCVQQVFVFGMYVFGL